MLVMRREEKNTNLSEIGRDTKETGCPEAQITLISKRSCEAQWLEGGERPIAVCRQLPRQSVDVVVSGRRSNCLEERIVNAR